VTPILEVRGLDVSYGPVQVLFGVDLAVGAGESLALLGTNGAGKSTLLRAVSGLISPDAGSVTFAGRDITKAPTHERVAAGLVQLAGGNAVFPTLDVAENLRVGAFQFLRDERRVAARIDYVLELFPELRARLDQPAGSMSGGEQQMVGLARTLLPEPQLLVIDELSLGLAPTVVQRLLAVMEVLRAEGTSLLVVEQSLNVAAAFADRAVFLERGEVRFTGDPAELIENGDLARAVFLGTGR
jgi:ABC-type branched-subunit amino acid transport system ATPase component